MPVRFAIVLSGLLVACANHEESAPMPDRAAADAAIQALGLPQHNAVEAGLHACGQPSEAMLRSAAAAGVRTIITLRADGEPVGFDEAGLVQSLDMRLIRVPMRGKADLEPSIVAAFRAALDAAERPTIVHCGSSNRVGALVALDAAWHRGLPLEEAIAEGRRAGLKGLEADVRARLALPQ